LNARPTGELEQFKFTFPSPPEDSTILYEGVGLRIVKNAHNGFVVVSLHHTANPSKRSIVWRAEAKAGLNQAKFQKEYDLDYEALFGEQVFPQFAKYKSKIVVGSPYPEFTHKTPMYGGFDYGTRNPSSFHVYAILDGTVYSIWELYKACKNISDFALELQQCPYWHQLRYIAADPSIWFNNQQSAIGGPVTSVQSLLYNKGVRKLVKGIKDETSFIARMNDSWSDLANRPPKFRIFDRCPYQIREFETAIYKSMSEKVQLTKPYQEGIAEKHNHSLDDAKYFFNSLSPGSSNLKIKIPELWKMYAQ